METLADSNEHRIEEGKKNPYYHHACEKMSNFVGNQENIN